jgi:hypothetical protein
LELCRSLSDPIFEFVVRMFEFYVRLFRHRHVLSDANEADVPTRFIEPGLRDRFDPPPLAISPEVTQFPRKGIGIYAASSGHELRELIWTQYSRNVVGMNPRLPVEISFVHEKTFANQLRGPHRNGGIVGDEPKALLTLA